MPSSHSYIAPKSLDSSCSLDFLRMAEDIFSSKGKQLPDVVFDLKNVESTGILGLLLIYKFVEYTTSNRCFLRPQLHYNNYLESQLKEYGFWNLLSSYMRKNENDGDKGEDDSYKDLKSNFSKDFFLAPMPLLRSNLYKANDLEAQISAYYSNNETVESIVLNCLNEILLNFWEHAVDDTQSILVARGNKNRIEIACADTGNGIISTLSPTLEDSLTKEKVLEKSLERNITSKKDSNHMGCGLWVVNQLVTANRGRLNIYSEGAFVFNRFGKMQSGRCAFWKGTIIYLSLPLDNPIGLTELMKSDVEHLKQYKINFVDI